jgi:hypothetical protein
VSGRPPYPSVRKAYGVPDGTAAWKDWGARVYAEPGWSDTKKRYWASRWRSRRCFWCQSRDGLQLNHLTYRLVREGRTPLFTLVPLCERDHKIETWWSRQLRRKWLVPLRVGMGPHVAATLHGWLVIYGTSSTALFVAEHQLFG